MKKYILSFLFLIMFMPFMVVAKEYCTVVSGNGKNIGSEIACGTEHFYVVENKDDNIKMLGKYNLYVGANFDKIVLDINSTYIKYCSDENNSYFSKYYFDGEEVSSEFDWRNKILERYNLDYIVDKLYWNNEYNLALYASISGESYSENNNTCHNETYKFYPYTVIKNSLEGYALQNNKALGVTGEKGNANYPIYATTNLFDVEFFNNPNWEDEKLEDFIENVNTFEYGYTNFDFKDNVRIKNYLNDYYNNLSNMGFNILEVDMFNMKDVYDLVYSISNTGLPLIDWHNMYGNKITDENLDYYFKFGNLKDYVSNDYSWIWNTTYWTKTLEGDVDLMENPFFYNAYFVTSAGEVCSTHSGTECVGIPRAGIRPVVTISSDNIKYLIRTKTDGNGTIEVEESAPGGGNIQFKLSAKKGLKLSKISITTESGENVEFIEEDISIDNTGVYSISQNKFTMPYENITIEAIWESNIKNPNTGVTNYELVLYLIILIGTGLCIFFKTKKTHNLK